MAGLAAVNQVGESLVALLKARRDLLAAGGLLGPVPAALNIAQASLASLATTALPSSGCTLTCYRIAMSDHPIPRSPGVDAAKATTLAVELHYMLTAWESAAADEQAIISWAMLELLAHPVLDTSLLLGAGVWGRDETVQIIPDALDNDGLFRIWAAMQIKYRLCATFKARVVRIGLGSAPDALPVIARRLGFAEADVLEPA